MTRRLLGLLAAALVFLASPVLALHECDPSDTRIRLCDRTDSARDDVVREVFVPDNDDGFLDPPEPPPELPE